MDNAALLIGLLVELAIIGAVIAGMWTTFAKAGKPGWAALVPIYNLVVIMEVAGKPIWWIVGLLIPIVNLVVHVLVNISIAEKFGKGTGFGLGIAFLPMFFYPMLGFGDAQYKG